MESFIAEKAKFIKDIEDRLDRVCNQLGWTPEDIRKEKEKKLKWDIDNYDQVQWKKKKRKQCKWVDRGIYPAIQPTYSPLHSYHYNNRPSSVVSIPKNQLLLIYQRNIELHEEEDIEEHNNDNNNNINNNNNNNNNDNDNNFNNINNEGKLNNLDKIQPKQQQHEELKSPLYKLSTLNILSNSNGNIVDTSKPESKNEILNSKTTTTTTTKTTTTMCNNNDDKENTINVDTMIESYYFNELDGSEHDDCILMNSNIYQEMVNWTNQFKGDLLISEMDQTNMLQHLDGGVKHNDDEKNKLEKKRKFKDKQSPQSKYLSPTNQQRKLIQHCNNRLGIVQYSELKSPMCIDNTPNFNINSLQTNNNNKKRKDNLGTIYTQYSVNSGEYKCKSSNNDRLRDLDRTFDQEIEFSHR